MRKKTVWALVLVMTASVALSGCKKDEEPKEEKEVQEEEEEELRDIGERSDDGYVVELTNETGVKITGLAVKLSTAEEWPENMIGEGEEIENEEAVNFCFTPEETEAQEATASGETSETATGETEESTGSDDRELEVEEAWDVNVTLESGESYQLSNFCFDDMEACVVKAEDGVAFVEYESLETKETVSTKEQEIGLKEQREAEAAAAAQAQAEAEAAAAAQAQAEAEAAAVAQAQAEAEAAAAAQAAQAAQQSQQSTYQEPEQESEGCLGDW